MTALLTLALLAAVPADATARRFRRLGLEDGLSHVAVYSILQDRQGFLWFATQGGLDRYDGYRVLRDGVEPGEARRLPSVDLGAIYQDSHGAIWVGTWGGGLHRFEPATGAVTSFRHDRGNPHSLSDDRIHALVEDGQGSLWVGTVRGLDRVDLSRRALERWSAGAGAAAGLAGERVWCVAPLPDGRLWVGTGAGLYLVTPASAKAEVFRADAKVSTSLPHDQIRSLRLDRHGRLWVGTQDGLAVLLPGSRSFDRLVVDAEEPTALADGTVNAIFEDSVGRLWLGTSRGGLHRAIDPRHPAAGFERIRHDPADEHSLPDDDVRTLAEDASGLLWVGTRGGGVGVFDPRGPRFGRALDEHVAAIAVDRDGTLWAGTLDGVVRIAPDGVETRFVHAGRKGGPQPQDNVQALLVDRAGALWLGTYGGLLQLDRKAGVFVPPAGAPAQLATETVESLLAARDGSLWVGTRFAGLFRRDAAGRWSHLGRGPDGRGLSDDYIRCLYEARDGSLWIGTDVGGLNRRLPDGRLERFLPDTTRAGSLSDSRVNAVWEDAAGALWVGTAFGLDRLDPPGGRYRRFTAFFEDDGLPSAAILAILGDATGRLWISSHGGLSRVDPRVGPGGRLAVDSYGESDGLQGLIFTGGAAAASPDGELLFGGRNGLNRFVPQTLRVNRHRPPVVITDVRVLGERPRLAHPVTAIDRLDLTHRDTFFTVELAALDFVDPQRNRFAYKLEGFDPEWVESGTRRWAPYTRVDPGDYVLRVRAANSDGVWNETGLALAVHIEPPWWGTTWFRTLAAAMLVAALVASHQARLRAVRRRNVELERQVAERTREAVARRLEAEGQRRRLELVNNLVKLINQETEFPELLRAILEGVIFFEAAERGLALVADGEGGFVAVASSSWVHDEGPTGAALSRADVERDYLAQSRELAPGIFLGKAAPGRLADLEAAHGGVSATVLALRIEVEGEAAGYLLLSHRKPHAFDALDLEALQELVEHLVSAFFKGRALERLRLASEQKSLFLGIAAHDLRSPLGGILSTTDLLLRLLGEGRVDPELWRRFLGNVKLTAEQMRALVSDLLDVTAIETGRVKVEPRRERLCDVVAQWTPLHQQIAAEKGIELEVEQPPVELEVMADQARVGEVLDNLLSNALKFTARGGRVRLWCRRREAEVAVLVADSGPGLAADEVERAFDGGKLSARPTAGEASSGLGLVIVKKLVELHGGRVWVESRPGDGATFGFTLPLAPAHAARPTHAPGAPFAAV